MHTPRRMHTPPRSRHGSRAFLVRRLLLHLGLLRSRCWRRSLAAGMWGYGHFEHLPWRDAFLNSAMLLSGMGPIKQDLSEPGKIFAGVYALYSGLVVIAVTGLLLAPAVHHVMHRVHWEERENSK